MFPTRGAGETDKCVYAGPVRGRAAFNHDFAFNNPRRRGLDFHWGWTLIIPDLAAGQDLLLDLGTAARSPDSLLWKVKLLAVERHSSREFNGPTRKVLPGTL